VIFNLQKDKACPNAPDMSVFVSENTLNTKISNKIKSNLFASTIQKKTRLNMKPIIPVIQT